MKKTLCAMAVFYVIGGVVLSPGGWNRDSGAAGVGAPVWGTAQAASGRRSVRRDRRSRRGRAAVKQASVKQASVSPEVALQVGVAPADVLARVPTGARSLGFATAPLGSGGAPILLHFRGVPEKPSSDDPSDSYQRIDVDVYARTRQGALKRLRSFSCPLELEDDGKIEFERVKLLWLQPHLKRGPILRLAFYNCLIMPQGWGGRVIPFEMNRFSQSGSQANYYLDSTDSRGYLRVRVEESGSSLDVPTGPDGGTATYWSSYRYWNGQTFVAPKS